MMKETLYILAKDPEVRAALAKIPRIAPVKVQRPLAKRSLPLPRPQLPGTSSPKMVKRWQDPVYRQRNCKAIRIGHATRELLLAADAVVHLRMHIDNTKLFERLARAVQVLEELRR